MPHLLAQARQAQHDFTTAYTEYLARGCDRDDSIVDAHRAGHDLTTIAVAVGLHTRKIRRILADADTFERALP